MSSIFNEKFFIHTVKPRWAKELPDLMPVRLNSELKIDCQATGYPPPAIKLERLLNGNILQSYETGQLKGKYTKELAGQYRQRTRWVESSSFN